MGRHLTTGYSQLFDFLDNLAVNNDRQWFAENRQLYDCLRKQWLADLQTLIGQMAQSEPALRHTDAASCAYRIYRDIRFSHDKSPFKTYFSALISPHGRHTDRACWYLHMGADECGIYGGLWNPPGPMLRKVRQAVVDNVDEFRQIIATPPLPELYPEWYGAQLKTVPKGFDRNHPDADLLRLKEYGRCHSLSRGFFDNSEWPGELAGIAMTLKPMIDFLNYSIDE